MTEVVFIRHGQASAGSDNYDQLSPLGRQQAELLGSWIAQHGAGFDRVVVGRMARHRATLDAIEAACAAAAIALPAAEVMAEFDEFDHHQVLLAYAGRRGSPLAGAKGGSHAASKEDLKAMYLGLRAALYAWTGGELEPHLDEPYAAFQQRVRRGADQLGQGKERERVLVVSSGGVASQWAQHALGFDNRRAAEMNLTLRNSAISEFRLIEGAWNLMSWNSLPHLGAPGQRGMWTYY